MMCPKCKINPRYQPGRPCLTCIRAYDDRRREELGPRSTPYYRESKIRKLADFYRPEKIAEIAAQIQCQVPA